VAIDIPRLLWKKGERIALTSKITNASPRALENATVSVTVFNDQLRDVWNEKKKIEVAAGTSVTVTSFNEYSIPEDYEDKFLFLVAELRSDNNALISRSLYFPRVLSRMKDQEFYNKYTSEPIAWITLDQGPWLKPTIERSSTTVTGQLLSQSETPDGYTQLTVQVSNKGKYPSFMTKVDIVGTKRTFFASDNYFWLSPGEKKDIKMVVQWREPPHSRNTKVVVSAWNSKAKSITLP
jgi:beta-mannosidase